MLDFGTGDYRRNALTTAREDLQDSFDPCFFARRMDDMLTFKDAGLQTISASKYEGDPSTVPYIATGPFNSIDRQFHGKTMKAKRPCELWGTCAR